MVTQVVIVERLFDHHQPEPIERRQVGGVVDGVGGVGVHHEGNIAAGLADTGHRVHVPARLDLDFDPAVAGVALDPDALDELVERVLDTDRDP